MAYYYNQGAFANNLYPAPNNALNNANSFMAQTQQLQSGFANFNGLNGCLPLQNNYVYPPGYGYMPNYNTGYSTFNCGLPTPTNQYMFGNTNMSYTVNSNGLVNYNYSSKPSTLDYAYAIGGGITAGMNAYFSAQANQMAIKNQSEAQKLQYLAYQDAMKEKKAQQARQDKKDDLYQMLMLSAMAKQIQNM